MLAILSSATIAPAFCEPYQTATIDQTRFRIRDQANVDEMKKGDSFIVIT